MLCSKLHKLDSWCCIVTQGVCFKLWLMEKQKNFIAFRSRFIALTFKVPTLESEKCHVTDISYKKLSNWDKWIYGTGHTGTILIIVQPINKLLRSYLRVKYSTSCKIPGERSDTSYMLASWTWQSYNRVASPAWTALGLGVGEGLPSLAFEFGDEKCSSLMFGVWKAECSLARRRWRSSSSNCDGSNDQPESELGW